MRPPAEATLYTRPGCHLCEDTEVLLDVIASQFGLSVRVVDISVDRAAHDRWWSDIPVITIGARVLRAPIEGRELRQAIVESLRVQP